MRVDYLGEKNIPAPKGRDNSVLNNVFYTDDAEILVVQNDLSAADRASLLFENNKIEPFDKRFGAEIQ